MLDVEKYQRIVAMYRGNAKQKDIAVATGMSLYYVQKAIHHFKSTGSTAYPPSVRLPGPAKVKTSSAMEKIVLDLVEENSGISTWQIKEKLDAAGYSISVRSIQRLLKQVREQFPKTAPARVHTRNLVQLPGQFVQVDWGEKRIRAGRDKKIKIVRFLVCISSYSKMVFVYIPGGNYRFTDLACGLVEAFRFFGGVPQYLMFDNMSTIRVRRNGKWQMRDEFTQFAKDYGFTARFCTPARAQTKGIVERFVQSFQNALPDEADCIDLKDLNCFARSFVHNWAKEQVEDGEARTPEQRWLLEPLDDSALKNLPQSTHLRYTAGKRKVAPSGFFSFKGVSYGVTWAYADSYVLVRPDFCNGVIDVYDPLTFQLIVQHRYYPGPNRLLVPCDNQYWGLDPSLLFYDCLDTVTLQRVDAAINRWNYMSEQLVIQHFRQVRKTFGEKITSDEIARKLVEMAQLSTMKPVDLVFPEVNPEAFSEQIRDIYARKGCVDTMPSAWCELVGLSGHGQGGSVERLSQRYGKAIARVCQLEDVARRKLQAMSDQQYIKSIFDKAFIVAADDEVDADEPVLLPSAGLDEQVDDVIGLMWRQRSMQQEDAADLDS